jgi:GNAT superfamily N-acetyltransferase
VAGVGHIGRVKGLTRMPLYRFCRPEDIPMIVQAINACYDVHFPQRPPTTVAQFREEMGLISLWPSNTMVVLEEQDPVAVIVGTKRPYGCWVAKLGVRPDYQRQGLGRYILEALTRKLSIIGPRVISADVSVDNSGAVAFFEALRFDPWTEYWSFTGQPCTEPPADLRQVHPVKPDVALSRYESFHLVPQCWERDAHTLQLHAGRLTGYAFWEGDNIRGYILLHRHAIMDLAFDPHVDAERIGAALLQRAAADLHEALHMEKVATQDPARVVLERAGLSPRRSHIHLGQQIVKRG